MMPNRRLAVDGTIGMLKGACPVTHSHAAPRYGACAMPKSGER